MANNYPKGSIWCKWDLHVHTPLDKLNDGYKAGNGIDVLDKFCEELEKSDVCVFGITDYFSLSSFEGFIDRFTGKYPASTKEFFFNLELRLNETVNKELEEVNIHLLFNPTSLAKVPKFLNKLKVVKTGKDETPIMCSELKGEDYASATVTRDSITTAFEETYGKKAVRQDHFLIITAANNDGLRPERGKKRKENICDEIDKFSDGFFGGLQNVAYYLRPDRFEDKDLKSFKKPVISGSDAHSFDDLDNFLGKRYTREVENDGKKIEVIDKDVTWIKADPTFDGLKQILYEPDPGERISIGPVMPDRKDDYKIIRKMKFDNPGDFPAEIEFNDNLCSIIGSRSSGKSALLAYIAHSVDPEGVEQLIDGPGEGEEYHWDRIDMDFSIEWANGKSNTDSPGNVLFVPQNHLFEISKDPNEIKDRIEPVLFAVLPDFETVYSQSCASVDDLNTKISDQIDEWIASSEAIKSIDSQLKEFGDKKAIESQKSDTEAKIKSLKEKYKLSEADLVQYQAVSGQVSSLSARNSEIDVELAIISKASDNQNYFTSAKVTLSPVLSLLPVKLQGIVKQTLETASSQLLKDVSRDVLDYKKSLEEEKSKIAAEILKLQDDNKALIEKYQKNTELELLVKALNGNTDVLNKINKLETKKHTKEIDIKAYEKMIQNSINERLSTIAVIKANIEAANQSHIVGIKFGVEYGIDREDSEHLSQMINTKESTSFVQANKLKIDEIRNNSKKFLADIYSGKQKIIAHCHKADVLKEAFQLTEKVLFTAEMEGDKIGGFSESTMTPGKRALFALRLILAESEDTWPLLIDQPEDNLDSRSIYDVIVPFLKEKKKERQIIMVSHNANLVIGSDTEQLIVANRNGSDRRNLDGKQFNYLTGSLEFSSVCDETCQDTLKSQGICEHACAILDGGKTAFETRKNKYNIR